MVTVKEMRSISDKTLVPLSLVITFIGGVFWLSMLYAQTDANKHKINEIEKQQRTLIDEVKLQNLLVIERLARIEERLKSR